MNLSFPNRGTAHSMLGTPLSQGAESGFTYFPQPELQLHVLWLQNEMSEQVFNKWMTAKCKRKKKSPRTGFFNSVPINKNQQAAY